MKVVAIKQSIFKVSSIRPPRAGKNNLRAVLVVLVIFTLMTSLPTMSAQVGRPNAPAKKPTSKKSTNPAKPKKKPVTQPPTKTVDSESAALKELFNSFVQIPAGEFLMGSEKGSDDEKPVHRVQISRAFEMGKYEVTQAQWVAVMGSNPSGFKNCGGNCPVEGMSWDDAQQFIQKLNARNDGYIYRLPTEAEWEYVCRAGSTGDYAGDLNAMAWYGGNSGSTTHPVGQKHLNAWGLYDMHGNVWEWCQDWYDGSYYGQSPSVDPTGPATGSVRVIRGGSWSDDAQDCRSAYRAGFTPAVRNLYLGFRLVRTNR